VCATSIEGAHAAAIGKAKADVEVLLVRRISASPGCGLTPCDGTRPHTVWRMRPCARANRPATP